MGRSTARLVSFLVFVLATRPLPAADTLSLARVLDAVRTRNPRLQGAQALAEAADATPARASAWEDPVVSWEAWNIPQQPFSISHADNNIFRVSQKVPFPGKRTLAGEMARREADGLHHEVDAVTLDAVTVAKRAYADLWLADRTRAVYARDLELSQGIARLVAQRYAATDVPQTDVVRAEVEVSHAVGDIRTATFAVDEARAALAAVASTPSAELAGVPQDPPPAVLPASRDDLVARALAARPELAAGDAAVAREKSGLRLAEKGYLPDFEVSFGRFVNANAGDGFGAMASMTVPLAWKGKVDAGVAEARARIVAAEADRRRVADEVRRDVEQAWARAESARVRHGLFADTHVPHAEQAMRITESAYVGGTTDLSALLETARNLERVHLEHLEATAAFEKAYADLERAVGGDLPREVRQ